MKLCDADIEKHLDAGILKINPRPEASRITGASVDLTLSGKFRIFDYHAAPVIDLGGPRAELDAQVERITRAEVNIPEGEAFYLHPGELALGVTIEEVALPDTIAGWINGRSSLARLGLMVHITAHGVDPGFEGPLVLEFFNAGKVSLALRPGMRICSISFEPLSGPAVRPYNKRADAKYLHQQGAVGSRISADK